MTAVQVPTEKIKNLYAPRLERCVGSPELLYRFCCAIPPFFTQAVAKACGSMSKPFLMRKNVTGILRHMFDCSYWYCTLNKYDLLTSKGFVDLDKYFIHLDLWTHLNTAFSDHIIDAKVNCKESHRFHLPLNPCEFFRMNECVRNYLKVKCSHPFPTKGCLEQKNFFDACGDYFV
ncbi:unnamed protein product [Arctia plantaginis]|uniref:Uncharacterized protein n=1 Tax=Arctia plantaginis TaxID=874455 RepID=A0A8S1B4U6_ARCPL|nr:unnamed protein product [Arctia plantaginis]